MRIRLILPIIILTGMVGTALAAEFAYERPINIPTITEETSVWIPLDAHARQRENDHYTIVDDQEVAVPFKRVDKRLNLLEFSTIETAPNAAETIPKTTIHQLVDNNPDTYFQPATDTRHIFRFRFEQEVAPEYLVFVLRSGWIDHIKVRIGSGPNNLRDAFVGTPAGTLLHLSGEKGTYIEIVVENASGVLQIAEAGLVAPTVHFLMRAAPERSYSLRYGSRSGNGDDPQSDEVFVDKDAILASLGPVQSLVATGTDADRDGVMDELDTCPNIANWDQTDRDSDGIGDACDNAPLYPNGTQKDQDGDGTGDQQDNCPRHANPDQKDVDLDGIGWVCDDLDGDGAMNGDDNCVGLPNRDQQDLNNDGIGDACADDRDSDGVPRTADNCSTKFNPDQSDSDRDGIGDECDVCPEHYDPKQIDRDENGIGDVCQNAIEETVRDTDADGIPDDRDICPRVSDPDQKDDDDDRRGNACDNCPALKNTDQRDRNKDGKGDVCTDTDGDGILDPYDNCPTYTNEDQEDKDEDGTGNPCDDDDGDRIENARDNCPYDSNPRQSDEDMDGVGNVCDTSDDRWSEQRPWIVWGSMALIIVVLAGLGGLILMKTKP